MPEDRLRQQPSPEPKAPEPPEPPGGPPKPEPQPGTLTAAADAPETIYRSGMPGQREGRPTSAAEAALQLTLKWMDHTSDAAELALGDPELAEAQAQSVTAYFEVILSALRSHFPALQPSSEQRRLPPANNER